MTSPFLCRSTRAADRRPFRAALNAELMSLIADDFYIPTTFHLIVVSVDDDPLSLLASLPNLADRHAVSAWHLEGCSRTISERRSCNGARAEGSTTP